MTPSPAECVAAGARFLNAAIPDWWRHVDADRLDMSSGDDDLIEQLGEAGHVLYRFDQIAFGVAADLSDLPRTIPLDVRAVKTEQRYAALTDLWRREIRRREHAAVVADAVRGHQTERGLRDGLADLIGLIGPAGDGGAL